jgi:hypothetical protein
MKRPSIQYNIDIVLTGHILRIGLHFRSTLLQWLLPAKQRYIMDDTTQKKPGGATYGRALTGIGFNLLVGNRSHSLECFNYAV